MTRRVLIAKLVESLLPRQNRVVRRAKRIQLLRVERLHGAVERAEIQLEVLRALGPFVSRIAELEAKLGAIEPTVVRYLEEELADERAVRELMHASMNASHRKEE